MEEKNKNIIYSIIAILLGIIIGGCTQVKASTLEDYWGTYRVYVRTHLDYAYVDPGMHYPINIDNAGWQGLTDINEYEKLNTAVLFYNVMHIRFCNIGQSDNAIPISIEDMGYYGRANQVKYYTTKTPCTWNDKSGFEVEIQIRILENQGLKKYVDLDTGRYQTQVQIQINAVATSTGVVAKIRYFFSENMSVPEDATITDTEVIKDIQETLNNGNFNKPTRDEILSEYEDKEKELWEIIGVPNYNDIKIDIDSNTSNKIWNLIVYILRQNTAILTMVITILSISILKLILNR